MKIMMMNVIVAAALTLAAPHQAQGQASPDSIKHRNECRLAGQIVRTGHPGPHAEWAANYLPFCDPSMYAEALGGALLRLRTSNDSTALLLHWGAAAFVRDRTLFNAVITVAQDRTASLPARLWALRTLAQYLDPEGRHTIESMSGAECISGRILPGHSSVRIITPLPPGWEEHARAVGATVAAEHNGLLRSAGRCVSSAPVSWDRNVTAQNGD
jgi:hypothetical protein